MVQPTSEMVFEITEQMLADVRNYPRKMGYNKFAICAVIYPEIAAECGWDFELAESKAKAYEIRERLEKTLTRSSIHIIDL